MELISFLGKLFGYTPEIANVISGELRSVSEARRRPKIQQKNCRRQGGVRRYYIFPHQELAGLFAASTSGVPKTFKFFGKA